MIGDPQEYSDSKIHVADNPQDKLNELVARVENAFARLNSFYIALGRSSLRFRIIYNGIINGENGIKLKNQLQNQKRRITSFALNKNVQNEGQNEGGDKFEIEPTDENDNTFTTHNNRRIGIDCNFFGESSSQRSNFSGYEVFSEGRCTQEELRSTAFYLAQALVGLKKLRNELEKTQERINAAKRIDDAVREHKESIQKALSETERIKF